MLDWGCCNRKLKHSTENPLWKNLKNSGVFQQKKKAALKAALYIFKM
jgi:hypothetical protein